MNKAALLAAVVAPLLFAANPARTERLQFDHIGNPAIAAAMDSGNKDLILFDDSNPAYLFDRIVVHGTSQTNWTEALEIITRSRKGPVKSAQDWVNAIAAQGDPACHGTIAVIAQAPKSITFSRTAVGCAAAGAPYGLYRIVEGKRSLFLLSAVSTAPLSEESRARWMTVLASAHLEK